MRNWRGVCCRARAGGSARRDHVGQLVSGSVARNKEDEMVGRKRVKVKRGGIRPSKSLLREKGLLVREVGSSRD